MYERCQQPGLALFHLTPVWFWPLVDQPFALPIFSSFRSSPVASKTNQRRKESVKPIMPDV